MVTAISLIFSTAFGGKSEPVSQSVLCHDAVHIWFESRGESSTDPGSHSGSMHEVDTADMYAISTVYPLRVQRRAQHLSTAATKKMAYQLDSRRDKRLAATSPRLR